METRLWQSLAEQYDVHPNQINDWKKQLMDRAGDVFGKESEPRDAEAVIKALQAKVGELTMENDFLEQGLTRIHGPRGKKW